MPPLHIKLGLIKQLVKALDKESAAFKYLIQKFPSLSETKIKEGIFVGPDIRQLLNDNNFEQTLDNLQLAA
jgi:DNA repair photolyase